MTGLRDIIVWGPTHPAQLWISQETALWEAGMTVLYGRSHQEEQQLNTQASVLQEGSPLTNMEMSGLQIPETEPLRK